MAAVGLGGGASPNVPWLPSDQNWQAWAYDPVGALNTSLPAAGVLALTRVNVRSSAVATNLIALITAGGTALTAAENFLALYNSAGLLLGQTADQSANWAGAFSNPQPIVSGPISLAPGFYWIAFLTNFTGTAPSFARGINQSGSFVNGGNGPSTARYATNGAGLITPPASITPSANALGTITYWAGIS